jgi:hypothetical protein
MAIASAQDIYTVKANGLAEDIALPKGLSHSLTLNYTLDLPSTLQARQSSNGTIGIYSADSALFGNISYGSSNDQALVAKARQNSQKDNLVFALPAPVIEEANQPGYPSPSTMQASYKLTGNQLALVINVAKPTSSPIVIDPSIIVTSANAFSTTGNNEGDIAFNSTNSTISEAGLDGGSISAGWASTTAFSSSSSTMPARGGFGSVVYNGYLYVMGGKGVSSSGDCTATGNLCNGVFYDTISSNGTIGSSWTATTPFTSTTMPARTNFGAVVDNGYIYVMGGQGAPSGDCTATNNYYCNGTFYALICTGSNSGTGGCGSTAGTIGSWVATTPFTSTAMPARYGLGTVAYQGNLYVMGGIAWVSTGDCTGGGNDICNGTFYAPINANGTIGSWAATTTFPSSSPNMPNRYDLGAVAYNGYLYVMGGVANVSTGDCTNYCNGVFYAPINSNGTIGSWAQTGTFTATSMPARANFGAVAYNGYLYVLGGHGTSSSGDCTATGNLCNGTFYAPINANGTIGSWTSTTAFTSTAMPARTNFGAVAYNGYLYVLGGSDNTASGDCTSSYCNGVFYAPLDPAGVTSTYTTTTTFPSSSPTMPARYGASTVAYNGYLYVLGGASYTSGGDCTATSNLCNGVFYAPISSNGTIGSWAATTTFPSSSPNMPARYYFGAVAYNGYLYVIGGYSGTTTGDCGNGYCAGVFYAPISSNGTIGSWAATTTFPSSSPNMPNRYDLGAVAYNGYLYVMGGFTGNALSGTDCANAACNGVFYALICTGSNSGTGGCTSTAGTIGSWVATTAFPSSSPVMPARYGFGAVAYNGYLYVLGGKSYITSADCNNGSYCNGVFYALICTGSNSGTGGCTSTAGTIGSWAQTGTFTATSMPARDNFGAAVSNGYLYVTGGQGFGGTGDCNTGSWYCYGTFYAPINSTGTVGSWSQTSSFTNARYGLSVAVYSGYLYIMGGIGNAASSADCNSSSYCNGVYYTQINNGGSGTLQSWSAANSLPSATYKSTSVAYNGYIYELGGYNTAVVEYTAINSSGSLSAPSTCTGGGTTTNGWCVSSSAATGSMPYAVYNANVVAYNGYIYEIGGWTPTIQYTAVNSNGSMSAPSTCAGTIATGSVWCALTSTGTGSLAYDVEDATAVVYNGYIYEIGGYSISQGNLLTVEHTAINSTGGLSAPGTCNGTVAGVWCTSSSTSNGSLPISETNSTSVVYNDNIYEISGGSAAVYYVAIASNGSIGTWATTTSLPATIYAANSIAYDGYIYEIGGYISGGSASALVYYAPINNNGSIGTWTTTTSLSAATYYANSVAYNGYVYEMGGCITSASCGSVTSNVYYTGLNSIPRIGYYSDLIDLTGGSTNDPTPIEIMSRGTNTNNPGLGGLSGPGTGGIAVNYSLASNACINFSTPATLSTGISNQLSKPFNLSFNSDLTCGPTINIGRYVWVRYTLDDSQTVSFPDSSGNHTLINGITVYYHPNSAYRMRDGATFSNSSLQSLDAPP